MVSGRAEGAATGSRETYDIICVPVALAQRFDPTQEVRPVSRETHDAAVRARTTHDAWEILGRRAHGIADVIPMHRGDPDLPPPDHVIEAAKRALDERRTGYTPWQGILELRRAIAAKLHRDNALSYSADQIVVTNGSQEALYLAALALTAPGDGVVMGDPHYSTFGRALEIAGAAFVPVPTVAADGFVLRARDVVPRLSAQTRILAISSPHNPTGTVLRRDDLEPLAALARDASLTVLSDEIYEKLLYDGLEHVSIASLPGMQERTVLVNGFSKAYSMTGFRVGYLAAPPAVIEAIGVLHANVTICAPSVSQWAALAALEGPEDDLREKVRIYDERRRIVMAALDRLRVPYVRPGGALYVFADISWTGLSSVAFCEQLLERTGLFVSPGSNYGPAGEGYVRIAWLVPTDRVRDGMERLGTFLSERAARAE